MRERARAHRGNLASTLAQTGMWVIAGALIWGGTHALSSWALNRALAPQRRPALSNMIGAGERNLLAHAHIERVTYMDGPAGAYLKISLGPEQGYMAQVPRIPGVQHLIVAPREQWAVFLKADKLIGASKARSDTRQFIRMANELVRQSAG